MRGRVLGAAAMLAAPLWASGCVSVLPDAGPAPEIYRLSGTGGAVRAQSVAEGVVEPTSWIVMVSEPIAPRALASDRIAVMVDGLHISYASGARWNERTPRVVQERVLSAFEDDGRIRAAVRPEDGVQSQFELRIDLRRFEAVYTDGAEAPPTIMMSARARLVDRRTRDLVGSTRVEASVRASANRMASIVGAFDAAMSQAGADIARWTLDTGGPYEAASTEGDTASAAPAAQPSASAASSSR